MKILPGGGADESKIGVEQVRWRIWFTFLLILGMVYLYVLFCVCVDRECSKLLALHHSEVRRESRLRVVYINTLKIENGGGVSSAKSLLSAAPLSLCLSDLTGKESFLIFENFCYKFKCSNEYFFVLVQLFYD
ncbi:hypothetical protein Bca4012_097555 [Brassica carinata]